MATKASISATLFADNPRIMAQIERQTATVIKKPVNIKREIQKSTEELRNYTFLNALQQYNIKPIQEHLFAKERIGKRWRSDYYFENPLLGIKLVIEQEGATRQNGRHNRGSGYEEDMKKYNCYTALGIKLLRFTTKEMSFFASEIALIVEKALAGKDYASDLKLLYKF